MSEIIHFVPPVLSGSGEDLD